MTSKLKIGHSWYDVFVSQLIGRKLPFAGPLEESMERGLTPRAKKTMGGWKED